MPEPRPHGRDLSPLLQQVGRQWMTPAVAAGRDPRGLRLPLALLWEGVDRQRTAWPLLLPEAHVTGPPTWTLRHPCVQAGPGIRGERPTAILAAVPLFEQQGLRELSSPASAARRQPGHWSLQRSRACLRLASSAPCN
jgi:hypothetical protein